MQTSRQEQDCKQKSPAKMGTEETTVNIICITPLVIQTTENQKLDTDDFSTTSLQRQNTKCICNQAENFQYPITVLYAARRLLLWHCRQMNDGAFQAAHTQTVRGCRVKIKASERAMKAENTGKETNVTQEVFGTQTT